MQSDKIFIPYWVLIAAGAGLGFLCGLVPLVLGVLRKKIPFGIAALVVCTVIGTFASLLGAIPAAALFTFLILRRKPAA